MPPPLLLLLVMVMMMMQFDTLTLHSSQQQCHRRFCPLSL